MSNVEWVCSAFSPIYHDPNNDTGRTLSQIAEHNAVYDAFCDLNKTEAPVLRK